MARKTYTSAVEAYIDAELAAATDERSYASSTESVGEFASSSILYELRFRVGRELQLSRGTVLLALLPALVIAARAGMGALPQVGAPIDGWLSLAVPGITLAAAVWAGLVILWQARNAWRRALGRAPATLRFRRDPEQYFPQLEDILIKLGVAVTTLAAVVWLAWSGGEPLWLLLVLTVLPQSSSLPLSDSPARFLGLVPLGIGSGRSPATAWILISERATRRSHRTLAADP